MIHFCLKKRTILLIFLIVLLVISFILGFYTQNYSYNRNVYFFNTSQIEFKNIGLIDNYKKSSIINNKIAPGTKGAIYLIIDNPNNYSADYQFVCSENNEKPKGLYFIFNEEKYKNLGELIYKLNLYISNSKEDIIKVEWCWDFNGNDFIDTLDGKSLNNYYFEIALIPSIYKEEIDV